MTETERQLRASLRERAIKHLDSALRHIGEYERPDLELAASEAQRASNVISSLIAQADGTEGWCPQCEHETRFIKRDGGEYCPDCDWRADDCPF